MGVNRYLLIVALSLPLVAQIGLPGRRRSGPAESRSAEQTQPREAVSGVLLRIDDAGITLVTADNREVTAKRSAKTTFSQNGSEADPSTWKAGALVRLEATQDGEGYLHALSVTFEREGSEPTAATAKAAEPNTEAAPASSVRAAPAVDRDRPVTRRGKPAARVSADGNEQPDSASGELAAVRPSARETKQPVEPAADLEDPVIGKARAAVSSWIESLPNYFCQQLITRYASESVPANWRVLDTVSAALVFENGRERYTDIRVKGKPVKGEMDQLSGSWSTGEFGTVALDLFSPSTDALFRLVRTTTMNGRDAALYDFEVEQTNSHWRVQVPSQNFFPAYKGSVWLDRETSRILRIEMQARQIPEAFPLNTIESAVDFSFVRIGTTSQYLLPTHAEVLSCQRGSSVCTRNTIDFRNYHKYEGQSSITFSESSISYEK